MRYRPTFLAALVLWGCSDGGSTNALTSTPPTRPPSTPPSVATTPTPSDTISPTATGWLWLMVVDATGLCITGATLEIVSGQGAGIVRTQSANCDAWSYDGGYLLYGLVPGVPITVRASATGYVSVEKSVVPSAGGQQATQFTLPKG